MDMSLTNCWDCPVTLATVAGGLTLIATLIGLGLWLSTKTHFAALRSIGVAVAVLAFAVALGFTFTVPNWGIINPFATRFSVFSRPVARTIYFTFDAAALLAFVFVYAVCRKRSGATR